jgi:hypothetical protein
MKNTFGMSVFSKQYIFPIFFKIMLLVSSLILVPEIQLSSAVHTLPLSISNVPELEASEL